MTHRRNILLSIKNKKNKIFSKFKVENLKVQKGMS